MTKETLDTDDGMSTEIRHLREVFNLRFSALEDWMDNFQGYINRLTVAVEEQAKTHVDVEIIKVKVMTQDLTIQALERRVADQDKEIKRLSDEASQTRPIRQGAIALAASAFTGMVMYALRMIGIG